MAVVIGSASPYIVSGALLGYPRYKLCVHPSDSTHLYLIFGNAQGGSLVDSYHSTDSGANWSSLGTGGWDYHANASVDANGYLHVGTRYDPDWPSDNHDNGVAYYRRYTTSWQTAITFTSDLDSSATAHAIVDGSNVVVFIRDSHGYSTGPARIFAYRSTDGGATFGAGSLVYTATSSTYKRIGSVTIDGAPALTVWEQDATCCNIKIFRWNGSSFAAIANNTLTTTSQNAETRDYSIACDEDGTIHCSWKDILSGSNYVLRHSYRTLTGEWSSPATYQDIADNNEGFACLCTRSTELYSAFIYNAGSYLGAHYRKWTADDGWEDAVEISSSGDGAVNHYVAIPQSIPSALNVLPAAWCTGATGWADRTVRFDSLALEALPSPPYVWGIRTA